MPDIFSNITYIINNLKSFVNKIYPDQVILHIFNSKFLLDKKKIENLPIGLFGDFYAHELSFSLINEWSPKSSNIVKKFAVSCLKIYGTLTLEAASSFALLIKTFCPLIGLSSKEMT